MKGKPKKGKGFRGTPIKQKKCVDEISIDFNISSSVRDCNIPLGLLNLGENVCFFNSVVQALYSITTFREYVLQLILLRDNPPVLAIKNLFQQIGSSNEPVKTSLYVQNLELPDYTFKMQYDAHECLTQLLSKIYPGITDECIFKLTMLESTVCEKDDCGKAINVDNSHNVWTVELEDTRNLQTVSGILNNVMDPRGRPLTDYRCDGCQTINSCTKAYYVTHISDFVIIQLNIFKYIDGAIKKMIPTLRIDEEIYLWGNTMTLHAIIYHVGQQANSGHYTSSVRVNDTWFLISDSIVLLEQPKLSFTHRDSSVPYILIYKKRTDMIIRTPISTSDNNCTSSTNALDELLTPEMMMRQSLVKELNNQKEKIINAYEKINSDNSNQSSGPDKKTKDDEVNECVRKIKTPVKRKSKFSNSATKRSLSFRNKLDDDAKEKLNKTTKKRVANLRACLDDDAKEKLNKATKKRVANLRAHLDDDAKVQIKDKDKKRKKAVRDNLDDDAKVQFKDTR